LTWDGGGSERALEACERVVALEGLANVLGALIVNLVVSKTARPNKEQPQTSAPPQTTKPAQFDLGSERALERGECLVDFQSLADVLGTFPANVVTFKAARVNQGTAANGQRPARNCSLCGPRGLDVNRIGDKGAQHLGESLKINTTLIFLQCALASPRLQDELALLSAGHRLTTKRAHLTPADNKASAFDPG
jgi:hypothetical protein